MDYFPGVDLRIFFLLALCKVKFLNNWPLQNSTDRRNIGPLRYERGGGGQMPPPRKF